MRSRVEECLQVSEHIQILMNKKKKEKADLQVAINKVDQKVEKVESSLRQLFFQIERRMMREFEVLREEI